MSSRHLRFILLEQGLGSGLFNLVLNGAIAWLLFRHLQVVPLWGQLSIAGDTIGTCFFLPFCTALIVTPLARKRVRAGTLAALEWTRQTHRMLRFLPSGTLRRAVVLGVLCVALVGSLAVAGLRALQIAHLDLWPFIAFKAGFAAALAALVTPLISVWAIAEPAWVRAAPGQGEPSSGTGRERSESP